MKATFELDPYRTLEIQNAGGDASEGSIAVRLLHRQPGLGPDPDKTVRHVMHFQPSFVRAIATALLSAATEAK